MKPFKNLWSCRVALPALAALCGLSIAFAPTSAAHANQDHSGKVQVRLTTKGAAGQTVWVRPDSPEARRARAIESRPAPVRAAEVAAPGTPADSSLCRPMRVYNFKGAKSYLVPKGMKLLRCVGANGKRAKGAPYCTADLPCADGPRCAMKMTCATDA